MWIVSHGFGLKDRHSVIERLLLTENKVDYIYFIDENFGINKKTLETICNIMKKNNVEWGCQTSIDIICENDLELMKSCNCISVEFGIESFSPSVLINNKRMFDQQKCCDLIRYAAQIGLNPLCFLLFFLPKETKSSIRETITTLKTLGNKVRVSCGVPYPFPNTDLWKDGFDQHDEYFAGIQNVSWKSVELMAGRIGHSYYLIDDNLRRVIDKYGANHYLNDEFLDELYSELLSCIDGK